MEITRETSALYLWDFKRTSPSTPLAQSFRNKIPRTPVNDDDKRSDHQKQQQQHFSRNDDSQ